MPYGCGAEIQKKSRQEDAHIDAGTHKLPYFLIKTLILLGKGLNSLVIFVIFNEVCNDNKIEG